VLLIQGVSTPGVVRIRHDSELVARTCEASL
jgi:hypothetical protein